MAHQAITTVIGETYKATIEFTAGTSSTYSFRAATTSTGADLASTGLVSDTESTISFVATGTTSYINVHINNTDTHYADFDNISVKTAGADRSGQGNHFDVVGTLSRAATVSGGLADYSSFSASNYLSSTSANFDVDGVAFTFAIAFKSSGVGASSYLFSTGESATGKLRSIYMQSSGNIGFNIYGDVLATPGAYDDGSWHTLTVRSNAAGTSVRIDIDGITVAADTGMTFVAYTFSNFYIGVLNDGGITSPSYGY